LLPQKLAGILDPFESVYKKDYCCGCVGFKSDLIILIVALTKPREQLNLLTTETTPGKAEPGRFLQLDVLRFIALLLVIERHQIWRGEFVGVLGQINEALYRFGWTGVDLFFVLSGFLVGGDCC
jgi:hypothetical protein